MRNGDLDTDGENIAIGNLNDAYMIASLVLAEKISPLVAASLIASLSHDLGHPEALSRFVGPYAANIVAGCAIQRHAQIAESCRALLEFKEKSTQPP